MGIFSGYPNQKNEQPPAPALQARVDLLELLKIFGLGWCNRENRCGDYSYRKMNERELIGVVEKARSGDLGSFEELVREYEGWLFRLIGRHGPREEVEVIAQESFLAAFLSLKSLRDPKLFRNWLNGIAIRKCRDAWRQRYREGRNKIPTPASVTADSETTLFAREILENLSPQDRMIVTLLYLEEFSVAEVAKLLNSTEVAVKVRAHRLKKKISRRVEV